MLTYSQSTGELRYAGELIGIGFSGFEAMKNKPNFEDTLHGPIPKRTWAIFMPRPKGDVWTMTLKPESAPVPRTAHGTFTIQAGDESTVSHGCIVMPKATVDQVASLWTAGNRQLRVIA